eukprot:ANDGO_03803.mRNA.1 hypothetical protein
MRNRHLVHHELGKALEQCDFYLYSRQFKAAFDVCQVLIRRFSADPAGIGTRIIHTLYKLNVSEDLILEFIQECRKSIKTRRTPFEFLAAEIEVSQSSEEDRKAIDADNGAVANEDVHAHSKNPSSSFASSSASSSASKHATHDISRKDNIAAMLEAEQAKCAALDQRLSRRIKDLTTRWMIEAKYLRHDLLAGAAQEMLSRHPHSDAVFQIVEPVLHASQAFYIDQLKKFVSENRDHPNAAKRAYLKWGDSIPMLVHVLDTNPLDPDALFQLTLLESEDWQSTDLNPAERFALALEYAPGWSDLWHASALWISENMDEIDQSWLNRQRNARSWWIFSFLNPDLQIVRRQLLEDPRMVMAKAKWSHSIIRDRVSSRGLWRQVRVLYDEMPDDVKEQMDLWMSVLGLSS